MGKLIAFEGIDRAGKSTAISALPMLLGDCRVPIEICGELRSPLATVIREALAKGSSGFLKTFLFAADRAWIYEAECTPALERGHLVLWDRYVDSAIVYRSVEFTEKPQPIDTDFVRYINKPFAKPDLTIYIDVSVATSVERAKAAGSKEPYNPQFLEKVREEYGKLSQSENYITVNGEQDPVLVAKEISDHVRKSFEDLFV